MSFWRRIFSLHKWDLLLIFLLIHTLSLSILKNIMAKILLPSKFLPGLRNSRSWGWYFVCLLAFLHFFLKYYGYGNPSASTCRYCQRHLSRSQRKIWRMETTDLSSSHPNFWTMKSNRLETSTEDRVSCSFSCPSSSSSHLSMAIVVCEVTKLISFHTFLGLRL